MFLLPINNIVLKFQYSLFPAVEGLGEADADYNGREGQREGGRTGSCPLTERELSTNVDVKVEASLFLENVPLHNEKVPVIFNLFPL